MRSIIAYIAILALAATQVKPQEPGCSDDHKTIRCKGDWKSTEYCMQVVGDESSCFCFHKLESFAVANNHFSEFEACCNKKAGGWREC